MDEIKDLLEDELENEASEQESKRIVKSAIPIEISNNIRLVLASDRKNIMVQTKTDGKDKDLLGDEEDFGWRTKGYYGTSNWNGILNKLCAMHKDEKLTKEERGNIETVKQLVKEETSLINAWCEKIISTLQNNNINI